MAKIPDAVAIAAMTPAQRRTLYTNACRSDAPEAAELRAAIVAAGLTTDKGGLPQDHPVITRVEEICRSEEGRREARRASDAGLPAMAGVDPLLVRELGADYGTFEAEEMEAQGDRQARKKPMPSGAVAKTAAFFKRR